MVTDKSLDELTEDQLEAIVHSGIEFLRAMSEAYGSEQALQLWNAIAESFDKTVKGKILFALLTGNHESDTTIRFTGLSVHNTGKIECIKTIRRFTNMTLSSAKNAYEEVEYFGRPARLTVLPEHKKRDVLQSFRDCGMIVS